MLNNILFINFFKKEFVRISIFILSIALINPLQSVVLSRLYGNLFENMTYKKNLPSFFDFNNLFKGNMAGIMLLIIFVYIVIFILYMTKNYLETIIIPNYFKYLRTLLFKNFINKYSNNFKDVKTGEILTKMFELNIAVIYLFMGVSNYFIATIIGLLSITLYYFYLNFNIGLLFFIAIIGVSYFYYYNFNEQIYNSMKKQEILYDNNENLTDRLSNLLNIYINNEQNNEINNFIKNEFKLRKQYIINFWSERNLIIISDLIITVCSILILIVSYYGFKNKKISSISLISIIVTLGIGIDYLFQLNTEVSNAIYYWGIIKSNENLISEILIQDKKDIKNINLNSGKIQFKNVSFGYNNKKIINNFNYIINDKEKIAVMGRSGSGKTTIMKLLINLHKIDNGEILIDNYNIQNIDTYYLRNNIIYINQKTILFEKSIIENMKYGTNKSDNNIINLLEKYDLLVNFNNLPNSIKTNAGVNGNNLSLGMQKIVLLIRGILKNGIIYIFDEPLTSLDSKTRNKVIKMLNNELKEKTVIIITHDKEILPHVNKILKIGN